MTQYNNENRGTLGKNLRREKDTHPEYTGQIDVDGVGYWLSAWVKEGQNGKFFSLSIKPKEARATSPAPQPRAPAPRPGGSSGFDDMDDSIPFMDPMKRRGFHLAT